MTATTNEDITGTSLRALWKRRRRIIIPVIAVLAAAGAFAAWGPIGIGPGPIGNNQSITAGSSDVPRSQPAWFVLAIDAGHSGAIIDNIELLSDGDYPAPHVLRIKGDGDQSCGGSWPVTGTDNFYAAGCAAGGLVTLLGQPVPVSSHVNVPDLGRVDYPGIGAAIETAPPGRAGCWMVTKVVIHYHVGIRHYTATDDISQTGCSRNPQDAAQQQRH